MNNQNYIEKKKVLDALNAIPRRGMVFGKRLWSEHDAQMIVDSLKKKLKLEAK